MLVTLTPSPKGERTKVQKAAQEEVLFLWCQKLE